MISVIVPVFNEEKTIERCLKSLICQSFRDIEIICVDDGSADNSVSLIHKYQKLDQRIRLLNNVHTSTGHSRNLGLDNATGEYVYFCDADDYLPYDSLETMYFSAIEHSADIICCNFVEIVGSTKKGHCLDKLSAFDMFFEESAVWNKLFDSRFILSHCIRFPNSSRGEDRVYLARCFSKMPRIYHEKRFLYYWDRSDAMNGSFNSVGSLLALKERLDNWLLFYNILNENFYEETRNNLICGKTYLNNICEQLPTDAEILSAKKLVEVFYSEYFNIHSVD